MLKMLWGWIFGYYIIHIYGRSAERFINLALQQDIHISDIVWLSDDLMEAKVEIRDIAKLREVADAGGCKYDIRTKRGLPVFSKYLVTKRIMLLGGGVLAALALYVVSSFALFIEVDSKEKLILLDKSKIIAAADSLGIGVGSRFSAMDFDLAEKQLLLNFPLLAFCDIERNGTLITINVAEKATVLPEDKKDDVGAIWAGKDALIEKILVLYGQTEIKSGDTVSKGSLLVSPMSDGRASAIIKARVWYEAYGECALTEEIPQNNGSVLRKISVRLPNGNAAVTLCGYDEKDVGECVILDEHSEPLYLWRGVALPIEIVEQYCQPQTVTVKEYTAADAQETALSRARQNLSRMMNVDAELLSEAVQNIDTDDGIIRVKVTWECMEDIGVRNNVK